MDIVEVLKVIGREYTQKAYHEDFVGNDLLREYYSGKAFAYEHAARMLEEADAS